MPVGYSKCVRTFFLLSKHIIPRPSSFDFNEETNQLGTNGDYFFKRIKRWEISIFFLFSFIYSFFIPINIMSLHLFLNEPILWSSLWSAVRPFYIQGEKCPTRTIISLRPPPSKEMASQCRREGKEKGTEKCAKLKSKCH